MLGAEHYHPLVGAIHNILSTDLAETTFAQLFDGLPDVHTVWDTRGAFLLKGHPLIEHDRLCDGAIENFKVFRDGFDPAVLTFNAWVMQRYQNASPGSREFKMRLCELVAASIHQIAVLIFQSPTKLHSKEYIDFVDSWKRESRWVQYDGCPPYLEKAIEPFPTLFFHCDYVDDDQYPHGVADVAGYWAEDRVLGGIVLFDRGQSGTECKDIYFHSGRRRTTFRVWRLQDTQFDQMVDFLLSEDGSAPSPFPLLASSENRHRHDPWDAIVLHRVFRDPWERKVPPTKPEERDVVAAGDYPELDDMVNQVQLAVQREPHMVFNWNAEMEAQAFPWLPRRHGGGDVGDGESPLESELSDDEPNSLCALSPPSTPPPPSRIGISLQADAVPDSNTPLGQEGHDGSPAEAARDSEPVGQGCG
ncbi:uncharacterized protein THITE_2116365 [Thermothielavioides terrestris NRRL 8126]|uniref:Uncharacterized protein n=1 Tax=Thermothielavioides terrestris (strain ATCC 38088 / NRRL 8126) TaxID=578455 RepID=G2R5J0_THETT|nr:uncharacterized protein THITE_2116365 [Thermothielavioides terrestris NRRL 8126]AEO67481.1 hypothetical protein THITE_2116365 [Thermothielavioides terrestris NRRL 8126]